MFVSCTSAQETHLPNEKEIKATLKDDLRKKMNAVYENHPNAYIDTSDFSVQYYSLLNNKELVGVYTYSRVGSHSSRKNFFFFNGKTIQIINKSIEEEIITDISDFIDKNNFTKKEKEETIKKIKKILSEKTTDSF